VRVMREIKHGFGADLWRRVSQQALVSPLSGSTHIAALVTSTLHFPSPVSPNGEIWFPALWWTGRDILLQARVLRI
jgi:hypothetical protein